MYKPDDFLRARGVRKSTAKEAWLRDRNKKTLIESFGFLQIEVWEDDFINHPTKIIDRCLDFIKRRSNEFEIDWEF